MKKCPKDADLLSYSGPCCDAEKDGWHCTRMPGHKGKHHCHINGKCYLIWS